MASISISPDRVHFPVPGTDAVIDYERSDGILSITGLSAQDRVVTSVVSFPDCRGDIQTVTVEFD